MPSLKVMTWNVENLFLPEPSDSAQKTQRFQTKLTNLAAVIDQQQPDVLALQEIGPDGALLALQNALVTPMPHAMEGLPDSRGIRVAFLSKLPFASSQQLRPFPPMIRAVQDRDPIFDDASTPADESVTSEMARGGLEVTVDVLGTAVTVVAVHFKSKLISYARQRGLVGGSQFQPNDEGERYRYAAYALYRRTGDAVTIRERVNQLLAPADGSPDPADGQGRQKAVIVCGDFNDEAEAATTQILQGPGGSEIGTAGFETQDRGDGYRLWNLAALLNRGEDGKEPAEKPFTRRFKGRGELIDHIFASHRLVNPANLPEVRTVMATTLPSVTEEPSARGVDPVSDHAAVVATFSL
jgi:endonuclease/exonuclease/phosphatase family metal-dependent hydrolase